MFVTYGEYRNSAIRHDRLPAVHLGPTASDRARSSIGHSIDQSKDAKTQRSAAKERMQKPRMVVDPRSILFRSVLAFVITTFCCSIGAAAISSAHTTATKLELPITHANMVSNLKKIAETDLLLQDTFYTSENLNRLFHAKVLWSEPVGQNPLVRSTEFRMGLAGKGTVAAELLTFGPGEADAERYRKSGYLSLVYDPAFRLSLRQVRQAIAADGAARVEEGFSPHGYIRPTVKGYVTFDLAPSNPRLLRRKIVAVIALEKANKPAIIEPLGVVRIHDEDLVEKIEVREEEL